MNPRITPLVREVIADASLWLPKVLRAYGSYSKFHAQVELGAHILGFGSTNEYYNILQHGGLTLTGH